MTGSDLTEVHWDAFFAFYMDTGGRKWGSPYLTRSFFDILGATMADKVVLVMAEADGRPCNLLAAVDGGLFARC